ncbi:pyridoxamine 5'-phosphate oxidase family protein [Amycolatopsis sp. EV170708-02-1]|uniref:pyridoxamine 5'-phosphate oxidase family protein n=1 Tax=Amycolatopsis sp. EV170708-02-1 TaxID=2919322 RepID=UPI001F0BDCA0|nr:pyridoxamine 5'-phosphate oxidase family protein [Amycolatopsis sp. EV170708-02-1]UMO99789.1 pyridoxamine 5'-phosphate oxidase family protein [Amycolatopsis sp. EV170708-02-1]
MDHSEMIEYVRGQRAGTVSTIGPGGAPQAAYLTLAITGRGEFVFDAKPDSRKVANLRRDGRIAIVVGGADGTTLQCEGATDFPAGTGLDRCKAAYLAAFPEFTESIDGGGVVVLRVVPTWARFGDFRSGTPELREIRLP